MGFASTSVILWPKRAVKLVLAARHNFSIGGIDLRFPVTHSSFSVHVPGILSLFLHQSSFLVWALWLSQSFILCAFPTHLVKAAQYLSCHLPGGFHQVSFTRYLSPGNAWLLRVPLFRLSCFLLCSSVTSHWHFGAQPWSSSILSCWSERLLGCFPRPAALGQPAKPRRATGSGKPAQPSPTTRAGGRRACPRLTLGNGVRWPRVVSPSCLGLRVARAHLGNPRARG